MDRRTTGRRTEAVPIPIPIRVGGVVVRAAGVGQAGGHFLQHQGDGRVRRQGGGFVCSSVRVRVRGLVGGGEID